MKQTENCEIDGKANWPFFLLPRCLLRSSANQNEQPYYVVQTNKNWRKNRMKDICIITLLLDEVEKCIKKQKKNIFDCFVCLVLWLPSTTAKEKHCDDVNLFCSFFFYLSVGSATKHVNLSCVCRAAHVCVRGRVRMRYLFNRGHKLCTNASYTLAVAEWKKEITNSRVVHSSMVLNPHPHALLMFQQIVFRFFCSCLYIFHHEAATVNWIISSYSCAFKCDGWADIFHYTSMNDKWLSAEGHFVCSFFLTFRPCPTPLIPSPFPIRLLITPRALRISLPPVFLRLYARLRFVWLDTQFVRTSWQSVCT